MITCLTLEEQLEIIKEKAKSPRQWTNQDLADHYGVSKTTIGRVNVKNAEQLKASLNEFFSDEEDELDDHGLEDSGHDFDWNDPDQVGWVATQKSISITSPIGTVTVALGKENYQKVFDLLSRGEIEEAYYLADVKESIKYYSKGNIKFENNNLYYLDDVVNNSLSKKIVDCILNSDPWIDKLTNFMENLMENSSYRAVNELYSFLDHNDIELTDDGQFHAWKVVRSDFKDKHSGTFDNSPGCLVEMPRNQVNENSNQTCSSGLHVCSMEYAEGFFSSSGDKLIKVKVNPRDVVSIPVDYNNSKMRCCKYEVLDVVKTY